VHIGIMAYLRYLCWLPYSGVQYILTMSNMTGVL